MKILFALMTLTGFGLLSSNVFMGREHFGRHRRVDMPPSVRQTPGAWRTFLHNNGFRGGK